MRLKTKKNNKNKKGDEEKKETVPSRRFCWQVGCLRYGENNHLRRYTGCTYDETINCL